MAILDQIGHLAQFPQRVISLVPSMTESLFDLGMGSRVVGTSEYCVYHSSIVLITKIILVRPDGVCYSCIV